MNRNKFIILLLGLVSLNAFAKNKIREVYTNDRTIKPIYLALGRSTVLKFREKPTNVVIGNKNYFNIEYINNDLTIQPLGAVDTNLFTYTESKRTYALILKIVSPNRYDDIVHVRWKSKFRNFAPKKQSRVKKQRPLKPVSLNFKDVVDIKIKEFKSLPKKDSYYLDLVIKNLSKYEMKTSDIDIYLTRRNKKLKMQQLFFRKESIRADESIQARVFLNLEKKAGFSLNAKFEDKIKKTIIGRKYL